MGVPLASQGQLDDTAMAMDQEAHEMKLLEKENFKREETIATAEANELAQEAQAVRPRLSRPDAQVRCA